MGATAIGTGLNSPPGYADLVTKKLREVSGLPVQKADNLVEATQDCGAFAQMSGTLKRAAVQISKICNDLRWLSSGPRCGLNEINLPPMQPGSSIMPGKVNPVMPELVNQICYQIIGYDAVVSMAAEASELELNMAEPVMAYDLLHGLMILKNACITLTSRCITGITANRDVCRGYVERSIGLVTALNPVLGYERSASIAKEALKTGGNVYDLVLEKGWLSKEQLDDMLKPENMTDPRARIVRLVSLETVRSRFPNATPEQEAAFAAILKKQVPAWDLPLSLDRLLASLEVAQQRQIVEGDLENQPPAIIHVDRPAILVIIDGEPILKPIENSTLMAVVNTLSPWFSDKADKSYYLMGNDTWYRATAVTEKWEEIADPPQAVMQVRPESPDTEAPS
jgi:hypothetical protein